MPLIKQVLQQQIFLAFQKLTANPSPSPTAQLELAKDLATAIDSYIRSATITIPPGQASSGQTAPGQAVATSGGAGSTVSPGLVATTTTTPSPPAIIT